MKLLYYVETQNKISTIWCHFGKQEWLSAYEWPHLCDRICVFTNRYLEEIVEIDEIIENMVYNEIKD